MSDPTGDALRAAQLHDADVVINEMLAFIESRIQAEMSKSGVSWMEAAEVVKAEIRADG